MATFFALLAPVSYFGCDFIETSLQSKRGFKNNLGPVINDEQVTDILAECLPSESGNVIQKLVGGDVYATITSLDETLSELADFDGATTADDLNAGYSQVTPRIGMYMRA